MYQEQTIQQAVIHESWWEVLAINSIPFALAIVFIWSITWAIKYINRGMGNNKIANYKIVLLSMILGIFIGPLTQWMLNDVIASILNSSFKNIESYIFSGLAAAILAPPSWFVMLSYIRRKGWTRLYEFLRVRHKPGVDYTTEGDDLTDLTTKFKRK